jgi:hypothetical protein
MAAAPFLHHGIDIQARFTCIGHGRQASGTKNPRWGEKIMRRRKALMEELGFSPWSKCALFISTC